METATQALHRLTSYEPGRDWDEPIDDPRVLQDLETNDIERLPWFYKHYAESLPRIELPRELPRDDCARGRGARGHGRRRARRARPAAALAAAAPGRGRRADD